MASGLDYMERTFERVYSPVKRELFSGLKRTDTVVEIGAGNGINFIYYPSGTTVKVVEPNKLLHSKLARKVLDHGLELRTYDGVAERLPIDSESVDVVVTTLVLCSVRDVDVSLQEIKRVLKQNGRYLFIEHVIDEKNIARRLLQHVAAHSPWTFFGDGCHPNRDLACAIESAGFGKTKISRYSPPNLGMLGIVMKPHISGCAEKS
jgi:ubiquinone/menaquinone biosynthesis C-methylase UbiE